MITTQSTRTQQSWKKVKEELVNIEPYNHHETVRILKDKDKYLNYKGKGKNRTLYKENPKLYKSIYEHTEILKDIFKNQGAYRANWNFWHRILFLVERESIIESLKCACGKKYVWTSYCRYCPDYKNNQLNKPHTEDTKRKIRISALAYIGTLKGQVMPRYNKKSISIIEEYGKQNGYTFMHAENGGEYFVKELGYFIDAYDPIHNIALEIDEKHHFNTDGSLKDKDLERQLQIETLLGCRFERIRYDNIQQ